MAAGNNGNFGDEIKFNVDVAKQMTVPDEIKLTGPTDSLEGHQSQSFTSQMVVPDDITFTTTLRAKDDSHRETVESSNNDRLVILLSELALEFAVTQCSLLLPSAACCRFPSYYTA